VSRALLDYLDNKPGAVAPAAARRTRTMWSEEQQGFRLVPTTEAPQPSAVPLRAVAQPTLFDLGPSSVERRAPRVSKGGQLKLW